MHHATYVPFINKSFCADFRNYFKLIHFHDLTYIRVKYDMENNQYLRILILLSEQLYNI